MNCGKSLREPKIGDLILKYDSYDGQDDWFILFVVLAIAPPTSYSRGEDSIKIYIVKHSSPRFNGTITWDNYINSIDSPKYSILN